MYFQVLRNSEKFEGWEKAVSEKWGGIAPWGKLNFRQIQLTETIEFIAFPKYLDKAYLEQKYVTERLPPAEIARQCAASRTTITKHLKLFGIPLRVGDAAKTRAQLGFGETWRLRQANAFKKELELIDKMKRLRSQGLSYWKIAAVLNAWGIPTKKRKGLWSAKQVHQILTRVCKKP